MSRVVDLERVPLARLLFTLLRERFDGVLELDQPEPVAGRRHIWIAGGMPFATDWVSPRDVLGEILVERRLIDPSTLDAALIEMARTSRLLGEVLVAQGKLTTAQVTEALRIQCARKIVRAFALRAGSAALTPATFEGPTPQLNVLSLIRAGVVAHYDLERVRSELGAGFDEPVRAAATFARYRAQFAFRADEAPALAAFERGGPLSAMATGPNAARIAALGYTLWTCQMLQVSAQAAASAPDRAEGEGKATSAAASAPVGSAARAPSGAQPGGAPPTTRAPPRAAATSPAPSAGAGADGAMSDTLRVKQVQAVPVAATDAAFERALHDLEQRIASKVDAFALLGVPRDADRKAVRAAWAPLSKEFHPDGLASRGLGHLSARVADVFASLSEANSVLSNNESRDKLRRQLEEGTTPGDVASANVVRNALEAERIVKDADRMLRAGAYAQASAAFERAVELAPEEPDYAAALAWCQFNAGAREIKLGEAVRARLSAIGKEHPKCARAHYYLGMVMLAQGNPPGASVAFTSALQADPRMVDAERQLRALKLRQSSANPAANAARSGPTSASTSQSSPAGEERQGLFKGLFGRKS